MKTVSSEEIIVDKVDDAAVEQIRKIVADLSARFGKSDSDLTGAQFKIDVSIVPRRAGLVDTFYLLLLNKAEAEKKELVQKINAFYTYTFDFKRSVFMIEGKEIYLNSSERLLLFRLLVNDEVLSGEDRIRAKAAIRRLRAKYGPDFPIEVA